jgi:hypothetical protein
MTGLNALVIPTSVIEKRAAPPDVSNVSVSDE